MLFGDMFNIHWGRDQLDVPGTATGLDRQIHESGSSNMWITHEYDKKHDQSVKTQL